jgi:TPP-dependent pyruvate/acetoin dehydrogenase alpha subunit
MGSLSTPGPVALGQSIEEACVSNDTIAVPPAGPRERDSLGLYEQMVFLRLFEDRVQTLYVQGKVRGPAHLGQGQEAVAVGVGAALTARDYSLGTYRGHAHALIRGASPDAVMKELLGRAGGICAGKGGSMHITSTEHGYFGSYAIVGAHLPIACGLAWASQMEGSDRVTVCFFGDGATNIGAFHEALNLAAVWRLPVVFVCENNGYMEYTAISEVTAVAAPAADRASAYGLERIVVDGNDVEAVRRVAARAVERARRGEGPALLEAETYRHDGHSAADPGKYRDADEVTRWTQRDPLNIHRAALVAQGSDEATLDDVVERARARVEEIADRALDAPFPDPAEAWRGMWSDGGSQWRN